MINIVCLITVLLPIGLNGAFSTQAQVQGSILQTTDETYLVDFSKEATKNDWAGDYNERIVQKSLCAPREYTQAEVK